MKRNPAILADFARLDADGATETELAAAFGITERTARRWRKATRPTYLPAAGANYRLRGRPRSTP